MKKYYSSIGKVKNGGKGIQEYLFSKNPPKLPVDESVKTGKKRHIPVSTFKIGVNGLKKLTKRERETVISYNQTDDPIEIYTHDLKLKRRLSALCEEYPDVCELIDVDEHGGHCFMADKERISIHVTRPYSEERRRKQSDWAKKNGMKGNQSTKRVQLFPPKDNVS